MQTLRHVTSSNRNVEGTRVSIEPWITFDHVREHTEVVGIEGPTLGAAMRGDDGHSAFQGPLQDSRVGELAADDWDGVFPAGVSQQGQRRLSHPFPKTSEPSVGAIDVMAVGKALHHHRAADQATFQFLHCIGTGGVDRHRWQEFRVFGRELHVMMRNGTAAVIPWERLIESLKSEARRSAERNSQKDRFVNQLGPIDGFLMTYGLKSQSGVLSNGTSTRLARTIELEKFELEPTGEVMRESVAETLGTGGRLRLELSSSTAKHTTVTVWVYPDSFTEFRVLKERLFTEGFLCAARPLPFHVRIGASPRGSASAAQ